MTARAPGPKFAVYHRKNYWLVDTCTGGSWSETVEEACWFDSEKEATDALVAADLYLATLPYIVICRVR